MVAVDHKNKLSYVHICDKFEPGVSEQLDSEQSAVTELFIFPKNSVGGFFMTKRKFWVILFLKK